MLITGTAQAVDVVEIHVIEVADGRFKITGRTEIEDERRPTDRRRAGFAKPSRINDRSVGAGRTDDDIG